MKEEKTGIKALLNKANVVDRFEVLLGDRAPGFISSLLQVINSSKQLENCDPQSILNSAATAATLDLTINQNLGHAWIVAYKGKAQFQIGWKGFVQLAQRTGQYKRINCITIHENQFTSYDRLTEELIADTSIDGEGEVIGYAAYLKFVTGFEKTEFWTKRKVDKHKEKHSKSWQHKSSPWNLYPDEMGMKTVLKNTISKWGIMSIYSVNPFLVDQAVIEDEQPKYPDNPNNMDFDAVDNEKEHDRVLDWINKADSLEKLQEVREAAKEYGLGFEYEDKEAAFLKDQ